MTLKYRLHQELEKCSETVIQDRTIYEDAEIFATNLYKCGYMKKRDYETYYSLYKTILNSLRPPDLMIYLNCSLRSLKRRIKERGRKMEKSVKTDYLKKLEKLYNGWIGDYDLSPVIEISTEKYDYLEDFIARQDIARQIEKYL